MKNAEIIVEDNYDMNALKTTVGMPEGSAAKFSMGDAAVSYIFNTKAGSIAFLATRPTTTHFTAWASATRWTSRSWTWAQPSGSNDKLTPYDAYRIGKALNTKVIIPDHYETGAAPLCARRTGNDSPGELQDHEDRHSAGRRHVRLSDDQDIGRYRYPTGRSALTGVRPGIRWKSVALHLLSEVQQG